LWTNLIEITWAVETMYRFVDACAYVSLAVLVEPTQARSSVAWTIVAGGSLHQLFIAINTNIAMSCKRYGHEDPTMMSMWSPTSFWALSYSVPAILQALLAFAFVVDLSFKDGDRSVFDDRLLAVCLLLSCFRFIWIWRLSVVGSAIYTIAETFFAAAVNQMLFLTFMLLVSFTFALLVLSKIHTVGQAVFTYRSFLFADGDSFNDIGMTGDHHEVWAGDNGALLLFAVLGAFFFNVIVLNIIIAIYGHEYDKNQVDTPLLFIKGRADYCVKSVLSSYAIPWMGTAFNRFLMSVAFVSFVIAVCLGMMHTHETPWLTKLSAFLFAVGLILFRMALIQCDWFSPEGSDADARQRFLWVCHTRDWQKMDEVIEDHAQAEMEERMEKLQDSLEETHGTMDDKFEALDDKIERLINVIREEKDQVPKTSKTRTP